MSENNASTQQPSYMPSYPKKVFYGYNEQEINNYITEMVDRDLNQYPINQNPQFIPYNFQNNNQNNQVILKLDPKNSPYSHKIVLPLLKENNIPFELSDDFDPDFWKRFYPENEPFFNYEYGSDLQEAQLDINNEEDPNIIEKYEGQVNENGERHGLGKLTSAKKFRIGHWREGQFTGWGREVEENGDIYEGKYVNGKLYGKGIYSNGKEYYLGEFRNKKMLGYGEIFTKDYHYCGQLWDKIPHGKGIINIYNEGTYEGEFSYGEIDGSGVFKWNNGNYYMGQMKKGKMNGLGKLVNRNGFTEVGYFRNDAFVKKVSENNS